jgi:hypothetical protein
MQMIKAIVRPDKVDDVKDALTKIHVAGMTVSEVRGHGKQKGHTAIYRGKEYQVTLLPKMQIETVVTDGSLMPLSKPSSARDRRDRRRPGVRHAGVRATRFDWRSGGNQMNQADTADARPTALVY